MPSRFGHDLDAEAWEIDVGGFFFFFGSDASSRNLKVGMTKILGVCKAFESLLRSSTALESSAFRLRASPAQLSSVCLINSSVDLKSSAAQCSRSSGVWSQDLRVWR